MFNDRLKDLRILSNLSQRELSQKLGVSQSSITKWENGLADPTAKVLIAVADFFDVSIDYLVGREDDFGVIRNNTSSPVLSFSEDEKRLLSNFRAMGNEEKDLLLVNSEYYAKNSATNRKKQ